MFFKNFIYILGAGCCLAGCQGPNGLKALSANIVDLKDLPDFSSRGEPHLPRPLMRITFRADTNLSEFARRRDFTINQRSSICNGANFDPERPIQGFPSVYDQVGRLDPNRKSVDSTENVYYIYLNAAAIKFPGHASPFAYDLRRERQDLCIELFGGNMLSFGFESPVMVVPKELLEEAGAK